MRLQYRKAEHPTLAQVQALLPDAALETDTGEVVIYTGWSVDHKSPDGPLVDWCDYCQSGTDLIEDEACPECGRTAPPTVDDPAAEEVHNADGSTP